MKMNCDSGQLDVQGTVKTLYNGFGIESKTKTSLKVWNYDIHVSHNDKWCIHVSHNDKWC